jgi:signal transduction histidine kinase
MWLLKLIINLHNCYIRWAIAAVKTDDPTLLFQAKACACAYATAGIGMCLFALAQLILPLFGVAIVHTISLAYVITVSSIIVSLWLLRYGFLQFSALLTVLAALYGQLVMSWEFGGLALFFIRGHLVIQISAILFGFKGISLACIVNMIGAYVLYRLELTGFDVWHGSDPKKRIIELYAYGFYFLAFTFLFTSIINYTRQNLIKSLQEANKHKSNFLSKVSHEIRTPLAGIIGAIDILSTTKLNDDQMSLLATAKNCSQTLMEIINDVLDLSKIESGKLKINMEKVHLSSLIESCFKIVSPLMEKKNVKSICRIPCNVPKWIVTDPIKLKQILINLLSNATKVTNNGTIAVSVSIRRKRTLSYETSDDILKLSSQNGNDSKETEEINSTNAMMICEKQEDTNERLSLGEERQRAFSASDSSNSSQMYLKFSVIDSGIGIEKEKLLTLFEPFSQVVPSEKRTEGTGLGLAITKQLVEKMGGSIHVYRFFYWERENNNFVCLFYI